MLFARFEGQHDLRRLREWGLDVVRQRERRPALLPRFCEHCDDIRRRTRLRDPDRERAVEARRLVVDRVQRRRREHHRHAVRATEEVLRVARDVRGASARRDQEEADVPLVEEPSRRTRRLGLALEQMPERLRLLSQLSLEPRHRRAPRRGLLEEADVAACEEPRGHLGRRADRLLERNTERMQVPDGVDHRQHGAR